MKKSECDDTCLWLTKMYEDEDEERGKDGQERMDDYERQARVLIVICIYV
ncbi:hypothetical protein HanRHA438_Chr01g0029881 [Helianthus annuus]|nr:hypothetical protein HanRHA438_Chr01g0029881 [Helianthus annuus]